MAHAFPVDVKDNGDHGTIKSVTHLSLVSTLRTPLCTRYIYIIMYYDTLVTCMPGQVRVYRQKQ